MITHSRALTRHLITSEWQHLVWDICRSEANSQPRGWKYGDEEPGAILGRNQNRIRVTHFQIRFLWTDGLTLLTAFITQSADKRRALRRSCSVIFSARGGLVTALTVARRQDTSKGLG